MRDADGKIHQRKKHARRFIWLFCIVTLAVVAGNLISAAIIAQFTDDSVNKQIQAALAAERKNSHRDESKDFFAEEARKESDRLTKAIEVHARLMARAQEKTAAQLELENQLGALCDFWIAQYKKDQQTASRTQRDSACSQAGRQIE